MSCTAAEGGGRVTDPGGVPEPWKWGTEGWSVGWVGLGLGTLQVFSSINDSMTRRRFGDPPF